MRTAAYDPSRNKKKNRSPKPRPKTLAVQSNGAPKSGLTVETPLSPCIETPTTKESIDLPTTPNPTGEGADGELSIETPVSSIDRSVDVETPVVAVSAPSDETSPQVIDAYVNAQGVRFISAESANEQESSGRTHVPYGLPCVRELLRFLVSLINPLERQNSEAMIHVGLRLLTIAVETAADVIAAVPSLLTLIQDETCRSLFSLLNSDRLSVVAAACRLCFLLFESARTKLKFQLETYLLKLMEIVAHESPKVAYERRLVALEAMAQLCRIPGISFLSDTWKTNYVKLQIFRIGYGTLPKLWLWLPYVGSFPRAYQTPVEECFSSCRWRNLYDPFTVVGNAAHCRGRHRGPLPLQSGWILL